MVPLKTHYKVLEIETDLNWVSKINGILSLNNFFFLMATILPSWQLKRQQKGKKNTDRYIEKKKLLCVLKAREQENHLHVFSLYAGKDFNLTLFISI